MQFSSFQGDFDSYFQNNFEEVCDILNLNSNSATQNDSNERIQDCQNNNSYNNNNTNNQQMQQNQSNFIETSKNNHKNLISVKGDRTKYNQKQYRQRQKDKLLNMEQEIQELSQKYEELLQEKQALKARNEVLQEQLELKDKHLLQIYNGEMDDKINIPFLEVFINSTTKKFSNLKMEYPFQSEIFERSFSVQEIRNLTQDEIVAYHGGFVSAISTNLNMIKTNEKQSISNLQFVVREMVKFIVHIIFTNPRLIRRWAGYNPHVAPPTFSFWVQIVQQLGLTEQQMKKMTQIRCILFEKFVKLFKILKKCGENLLQFNDFENNCEIFAAQQYLRRNSALQEMIKTFRSVEISVARFSMEIRVRVLNFLQNMKFVVAAYPCGPDFLALTHCTFLLLKQKQNNGQEVFENDEKIRDLDVEERLVYEVQSMRKFLGLQYSFKACGI